MHIKYPGAFVQLKFFWLSFAIKKTDFVLDLEDGLDLSQKLKQQDVDSV